MIKKDQVIPLVIEACPSYLDKWKESDNKELLYVLMGDLARHLLDLYRSGDKGEFPRVCQVIERLLLEGDGFVKELATIGFLEGIQSVWANNDTDPEAFAGYLLPESKKWWNELNDFWAGKIPHVGAGLPIK